MKYSQSDINDRILASFRSSERTEREDKEALDKQVSEVGADSIVSGSASVSLSSMQGFIRSGDPIQSVELDHSIFQMADEELSIQQNGMPGGTADVSLDDLNVAFDADVPEARGASEVTSLQEETPPEYLRGAPVQPRAQTVDIDEAEVADLEETRFEVIDAPAAVEEIADAGVRAEEKPPNPSDPIQEVLSERVDEAAVTDPEQENRAPEGIALSGLSVLENASGATIGQVSTQDQDAGDTHSYTVDDGRFEVVDGSLKLKDGVELDHETQERVTVEVTSTDGSGAQITERFEIAVGDVNEGPEGIALSGLSVLENASGATIGQVSTQDQDAGDTHSYTVDDGRFEVVDGSLKLKDGVELDHETQERVTVEVTSTDGSGAQITERFEIAVGDVNEGPEGIALSGLSVLENASGATIGQVSTQDQDAGDTHSYTVDDGRFEVVDGSLKLKDGVELDHETQERVTVEVTSTDGSGAQITERFEIAVGDVNEGPEGIALSGLSVLENASGATIGQVSTQDQDAGDTHSYTVDDGRFEVVDGSLKLKDGVELDHETQERVTVEVTSTDGSGAQITERFEIAVGDVNEGPEGIALSGLSVLENASGATIGQVSTQDQDAGDTHSYTVDDGRFEVVDGSLKLKDGVELDHETQERVTVEVTSTDGSGAQITERFEIAVGDVNEGPEGIALSGLSVLENASGATIGQVSTQDQDAGDTHSYTVDDGRFEVVDGSLKLKDGVELDHETQERVTVEVTSTDGSGAQITERFEIAVGDVNEGPEGIALSGLSVLENASGATIGQVSTQDQDAGDTHSYTVDDGRFEVVDGSLKLKDGVELDHETQERVTVEVTSTDGSGAQITERFEIAVGDVNEGPEGIALSGLSVLENASGATIGQVSTQDQDAGDTHSYTVDDGRFEVVDGSLKLKDGVELDHETQERVTVEVTSTDGSGAQITERFEIAVGDVNEGPEGIALSGLSVLENASGATIGQVSTQDQDAGDTHSYTVDDGRFEVVDGSLKLKDGVELDHETQERVTVEVTSTDGSGAQITERFEIAVGDVNEAAQLDLNVVALEAPDDVGIAKMSFGRASIENSGQSEAVQGVGAGETALWSNVGTFQGMAFDVRATVIETNTSGRYGSFFGTSGDNARVYTNAGQTTVKYEYFQAGTDEEMIVNGSFLIDDLDGGHAQEGFSINLDEVDAYGLEANTDINLEKSGAEQLNFSGEGWTSSGDATNAVAFNMAGTSGFTVSYTADTDGRAFYLDGNWDDSYFSDVAVVDTNLNHADVFTEGSPGTHVASTQTRVTDEDGSMLEGATITLTNAQLGDVLSVGSLPSGIRADVDGSIDGQVTVTLTGQAGHSDYEAALQQVLFQNDSDSLASISRNIEISVFDGADHSDPATMTVYVNEKGGESVVQDTGSSLVDDILNGNSSNNMLRGLGGDDTLSGAGGDDTLIGGAGNDVLSGGDGNDAFLVGTMDGSDTITGGDGAAWTDTIEIEASFGIAVINGNTVDGEGWTMVLDEGHEVESSTLGELDLSQDASGTLIFDDGEAVEFTGIERLTW